MSDSRTRGFLGPKYPRVWGVVRLALQEIFGHREVVSVAERDTWRRPEKMNPDVRIEVVQTFAAAEPYIQEIERAYGRPFAAAWRARFDWPETLILAFLAERLAAFVWVQDGRHRPVCHYIRLQPGEYRVLTGGVLPEFRRRGVQSTRLALVVERLFAEGGRRVFADAFEDNLPALGGQRAAGFQEIGRIAVRPSLRGRPYIRWLQGRADAP